jgi:hypothetical protein
MRNVLAVVALASSLLASGCFACGWDGADDTMLKAPSGDAILVCGNGGFSAMLVNGDFVEGFATTNVDDLGNVTYSYTVGETGAAIEFAGEFEVRDMDIVERDHANVLCVDLEARAWWTTPVAE